MKRADSPLDNLPPDVRAFFDSAMSLISSYMPGTENISFLVGRNVEATVTYKGGPVTQEVIADTLAHLAFYKKYFPKDGESDGRLDSPEKIIEAMTARWQEHRESMRAQLPAPSGE